MLATIFAVIFGLSLLPGRKPLCLRFAEKISDGILPDGAISYCRVLTWIWFAILSLLATFNFLWIFIARDYSSLSRFAPLFLSLAIIPLTFAIEGAIRRRRFRVVFHTSGSTGKSKTIVKTFESLAREVAYHRATYRDKWGVATKPYFLATIDPKHMYGMLWRVLLPTSLGCECDPEIILTPESLLAKMQEHEKIFLVTTPSFLDRFTAYADGHNVPKNCIEIITSGALLTKDVSDRTEKIFGLAPRQIFGSTETGGVASRRGETDWTVFETVRVRELATRDSAVAKLQVKSRYSFTRDWYTMGDGVKLSRDSRTFKLFGRTDRLVKINEERVNLAEMESRVRDLGFADCALATIASSRGPVIGAVLVLAKDRDENLPHPTALELRKQMLPIFPKGTVPKRFRIVRALPRNSQSKVLTSEVVRILESSLVEPRMKNVVQSVDEFSAIFIFDEAAPYFHGHFEGLPILPGVVQLGLATRMAEVLIGASRQLKLVKKMKFMHIIQPDVAINFRLSRKSENEFVYEYKKGDALCSSGVLLF